MASNAGLCGRGFTTSRMAFFCASLVEDEPLVDVMALDDVLFDDLEHEFLAEHVASHKRSFG